MEFECAWSTEDPDYIHYHNTVWGRPVYDDRELFAMLCLEGQQAGLSWLTILKRIPAYRKTFASFDAGQLAAWDTADIDDLMQNTGIIRNRLKIQSIILNARAFLQIQQTHGSFSNWLWQFVGGKPLVHFWQARGDVPVQIPQAEAMSKALKRAGFKFVGPTICYAFMQAVGMVNDHLVSCPCHADCQTPVDQENSGSVESEQSCK